METWGILAAWLAPRSPELGFHWQIAPRVRLCEEAPVSRARVARAMAWWQALGARFRGVDDVGRCLFDADGAPIAGARVAYGAITVTRSPLPEDTRTDWCAYGGVPQWAVVRLGADLPLVVEHELGHALGFAHVHRAGHVMNPSVAGLGPRTDGLAEALAAQ
ncbi:MAG: matrixin family metalloprotease [Myxococcota bacterium]